MDITSETVEETINRIHAEVIADHNRRREESNNVRIDNFAHQSDELADMPPESRLRDFVDHAGPIIKKTLTFALGAGIVGGLIVGGYFYHDSLTQPVDVPIETPDPAGTNCPINPFATPTEQYMQAKSCDLTGNIPVSNP